MPKPLSEKCALCAKHDTAWARAHHGGKGGCWDDCRCHQRRSFYRSRAKHIAQGSEVPKVAIEVPEVYYATLIRWQSSDGAILHALGAEMWRGSKKVCEVEPVHVHGFTPRVIREIGAKMLKALNEHAGQDISQYRSVQDVDMKKCPIEDCLVSE